ncbi:MAG: efflux RND transporter permease subunit [Fibrobacterota bacterium]|nr:efflux RND transporter permease subunit [Fibrobacterota bacterium]
MTKFAVKNPVTVLVLAVILLLAGAMSYKSMPLESFPEIKIPLIFVNVVYPGASPEDIERLITDKIEDKLEGLDGLKKVSSQSMESVSSIQIEFNADVDVETALRRVKDKVDEAKPEIPVDAEEPMVRELNFSNIPIFVISLSGEYENERLDQVVEQLKERVKTIPGVLDAQITGKQEKEVAIDADPARLRQYGVSLDDLMKTVQGQHRNIPGGTLKAGGSRFSISITGELTNPEEFANLVIRADGAKFVRVRDVADVTFGYARDRNTVFRLHGKNSQAIAVTKRTGSNIVDLVDEAKRTVEELKPTWPAGTNVNYTFDQSIAIRRMARELQNHILTGLLLVVLILSFFLGVRNSFFISTAIPFSMMMGFLVLDYMGVTLNMVVLFSLVIGLGMLVDDGIVVVENIYRHLQMGKSRIDAAIDGTKEVMLPVATATITTIFAFLPLLLMPGMMGQFFRFLPITVSVTLAGSLFVAFVFNPVFASLWMDKNSKGMEEGGGERFEKVKNWYSGVLDRTLRHPLLVSLFCIAFVVGGIMAYGALGTGVVFFPKIDPLVVAVEVEGPLGININETDSALKVIEKKLFTIPKDSAHVESFSGVVGFGKSEMGGDRSPESNKAYVDVAFMDYNERNVSSWTSMDWMQKNMKDILPGWQVNVKQQQEGPPQGYPVSFEVVGEDFAHLSKMAEDLKAALGKVPNLTNIDWDYEPVRPELRVDVDREQAMAMGVTTANVAMAVRGSIHGIEAAKYRQGKDEYNVMIRLDPKTRENFSGLDQITVPHEGNQIPLTSMVRMTQGASLAKINHLDGNRTIQVWAELAPGIKDESKPKAAAAKIAAEINVPPGYRIQAGSSNREQDETTAFLKKAFFIAVSLVFLTMVAQFNSVLQPFLVLIGIILSLGGVFWGLLIVHTTFAIMMTGIGIIALAGVVAKNGIVLIDFINHLRRHGMPLRQAVIQGGATRLRPVILTAVTAMIGLLPMATGKGIDFMHMALETKSESSMWWAPMAWGIFWGLLFNTLLVLVVVPTFYYSWEKRKEKMGIFMKADEAGKGVEVPVH